MALGKELDVPVVTDLGSGSLVDLSQYGLPKEPMPQELIAAGVSLVKLLRRQAVRRAAGEVCW